MTFRDLEEYYICTGAVNRVLNKAACYVISHLTHFKLNEPSLYYVLKTSNDWQYPVLKLIDNKSTENTNKHFRRCDY